MAIRRYGGGLACAPAAFGAHATVSALAPLPELLYPLALNSRLFLYLAGCSMRRSINNNRSGRSQHSLKGAFTLV